MNLHPEISLFDIDQEVKISLDNIEEYLNSYKDYILPTSYNELLSRISKDHVYLENFYQIFQDIHKKAQIIIPQNINILREVLSELSSLRSRLNNLQQQNYKMFEKCYQLDSQLQTTRKQNEQLFNLYEAMHAQNIDLTTRLHELDQIQQKLPQQQDAKHRKQIEHFFQKEIQMRTAEETKKIRIYYEETINQYQDRLDDTIEQKDFHATKHKLYKKECENLKKQLKQVSLEMAQNSEELNLLKNTFGSNQRKYSDEFQLKKYEQENSINSSFVYQQKGMNQLNFEFGTPSQNSGNLTRAYSVRTIKTVSNSVYDKQLIRDDQDDIKEENIVKANKISNNEIPIKIDPYFSHYVLTAQSIKIRLDYEEMLDIDMKPYYSDLIKNNVPIHLWADWVEDKLRKLIKGEDRIYDQYDSSRQDIIQ